MAKPIIRVLSDQHEKDFAEVVPGGYQTVNSGATFGDRDVNTNLTDGTVWYQFVYELKSTQKGSYRLTLDDWNELVQDTYSRSSSMRPAWAIRFYGEPSRVTPVKADLVVLDLDDFVEILSELTRLREREASIRKTD